MKRILVPAFTLLLATPAFALDTDLQLVLRLDGNAEPLPGRLYPGADTLGQLAHLRRSGHDHSWFVLDQSIIRREFALSGSEQNPDLTGRDWRLLLRRVLGKKAPGITVAGKQNGNWDQTKATDAAAALFTQVGPEVKGVYAQADNMMSGVIVAAKRAGIDPSKLVLVGSNCSIEGVNQINDGTQYATVLQSPIDDGKYAANAVIDLLNGKKLDKDIYLPHEIVTKANVKVVVEAGQVTAKDLCNGLAKECAAAGIQ